MFRHYKEFIRKPIALAWRKWWGTQPPSRQDRFAFLAPLMAVLVFMVAITSVFWYLKYEEIDREQEIVRRDVEYAQQRVRLRLLDKQEELMRFSKDLSVQQLGTKGFITTAQKIIDEFEVLYAEGAVHGRVMNVAVHPFIMGQPHRIGSLAKALEYIRSHAGVWCATGSQIVDCYRQQN
mgnify:CR=1 FL=1